MAGNGGNLIRGGDGNDTILGGAGADLIYGGAGNDSITSGGGDDILYGRDGGIALALLAVGQVAVTGSAPVSDANLDADTIVGGSGNSQIFGEGGNNLLYGGSGAAKITGGTGQNVIYGGSGTGVLITGGDGGDVIIGSDGGHDTINGGAGNDRIELRGGNNVANGGAGDDVIIGSTGNDILSGGPGRNLLVGGAASDVLNGSAADQLFPVSGITGDSLSAPTPSASIPSIPLPTDQAAQGWWSLVAGPVGISLGLKQDTGVPAITADAAGPYVAWTQTLDGTAGLYVAHYVGGVWTALGGSTTGTGIQGAIGSAANPSITMVGGKPVVAWTSVGPTGSSIEVSEFDASANGGQGGWVGFGNSLSAGGISSVGVVDNAQIVATNSGPVVFWRDLSSGVPHLFAKRFDGTNWVEVSTGSASGQGISGVNPVASDYAVATDGVRLAASWSNVTATGDSLQVSRIFQRQLANACRSERRRTGLSIELQQSPSLAYSGGQLFVAWVQRDPSTGFDPHIFVKSEQGGSAWTAAGAGAASGPGISAGDVVAGTPKLAAAGSSLRLVWTATVETASGPDAMLRTLSWNGSSFAADRPTDISGTGIGDLHGTPTQHFACDRSGRAGVACKRHTRRFRDRGPRRPVCGGACVCCGLYTQYPVVSVRRPDPGRRSHPGHGLDL